MRPSGVPRIALVHALAESIAPIHRAFSEMWPEAQYFDLLDTSLAPDHAAAGKLTPAMRERFMSLARYAQATPGEGARTDAILFTCSAFGAAIEAAARSCDIPVLKPNEAAFADALDKGTRLAIVVTFQPSLASLKNELLAMAAEANRDLKLYGCVVDGALESLKAGDGDTHDGLVAQSVARLPEVDAVILAQFSLARAAEVVAREGRPVITTPQSAVRALKSRLDPMAIR